MILSLRMCADNGHRRKRCPTSFLQCSDTLAHIAKKLESVSNTGVAGWEDWLSLTRTEAIAYKKTHRTEGIMEAQVLLRESTLHRLALGAEAFLSEKGFSTLEPTAAYRFLSSLAKQEDTDCTGLFVLDRLKSAIADPHSSQPWRKRHEVWRLVHQLQCKRKLHTLRNRLGRPTGHRVNSQRNTLFVVGTMTSNGQPPLGISNYLNSFFRGKPLADMARMLIKPLLQDLVHAALEALSPTSSPGMHGFIGAICKAFASHFVPRTFSIFSELLESPEIPKGWCLALLNPIPKALGLVGVADLCPLVLQNFENKLSAAIVLLQLDD